MTYLVCVSRDRGVFRYKEFDTLEEAKKYQEIQDLVLNL